MEAFRKADRQPLAVLPVGGFVISPSHTPKAEKSHSSIVKYQHYWYRHCIYFYIGIRIHIAIHYCVPDHCFSNAQYGCILLSCLDVVHYSELTFAELM